MDGEKCFVKGLGDYSVVDKVDASNTASEATITIKGETDRVYSPPDSKKDLDVTIGVANPDKTTISCKANGSIDGASVPISCVVWNPHREKAASMSDFGNEQYKEMLCVEPGMLGDNSLEPGKIAIVEQTITVSPTSS